MSLTTLVHTVKSNAKYRRSHLRDAKGTVSGVVASQRHPRVSHWAGGGRRRLTCCGRGQVCGTQVGPCRPRHPTHKAISGRQERRWPEQRPGCGREVTQAAGPGGLPWNGSPGGATRCTAGQRWRVWRRPPSSESGFSPCTPRPLGHPSSQETRLLLGSCLPRPALQVPVFVQKP